MSRYRAVAAVFVALLALPGVASAHEILVGETLLAPAFLTVKSGERVDFRKTVNVIMHLEFGSDPRQHDVVQIPIIGPVWAVFHRPGTHPYLVHVYVGSGQHTLNGVVNVVEDETHRWDSKTCGGVVMGECIER